MENKKKEYSSSCKISASIINASNLRRWTQVINTFLDTFNNLSITVLLWNSEQIALFSKGQNDVDGISKFRARRTSRS